MCAPESNSNGARTGGHPRATPKILLKTAKLPRAKDTEIVVYCEHGQRAWLANKLLAARGYSHTTLLEGHLMDWKKAACLWRSSVAG